MCDLWLHPDLAFHGDHIDLPVIDRMLCRIMLGAGEHVSLFSIGHVLLWEEISTRPQGLHFDKDRNVSLAGDDVDLPVRSPRIASKDLVAARCQILRDRILAPFANALVAFGHRMNSSRTDIKRSSRLRLSGRVF